MCKTLLLLLIINNLMFVSMPVYNQTSNDYEKSASTEADQLISLFRSELGIGGIWHKRAGFFAHRNLSAGKQSLDIIDREFLQKQPDDIKEKVLISEMDYYYLNLAFLLACGRDAVKKRVPQGCKSKWQKENERLVKNSRYLGHFVGQRRSETIKKKSDLTKYLAELTRGNSLIRKHLSKNFYELSSYKANIAQFNDSKEEAARPKVERLDGMEFFGIPEKQPVFLVIRDMFMMYFSVEGGEMKFVGFTTSN